MREWDGQTFGKRDDSSRGGASGIASECLLFLIVSGFVPLGCAFGQEVSPESGEGFKPEFEGKSFHMRSPARRDATSDSPTRADEVLSGERRILVLNGFSDDHAHAPLLDLRVPEIQPIVSPEFRPHGPSLCPKAQSGSNDTPLALDSDASFWQRMREFRGRDGLRLLTLWNSSWSSLSLQAGRRGGPSLQWTSRRMNHDGAKSGVFDTWFPVTLDGAGAHAQLSGVRSSHPSERVASERMRDLMLDPFAQGK
jgi:hypothetical protein